MFGEFASALTDVAAGVLVVAGLVKLTDPAPWVAAVRNLGVPMSARGPWTTVARVVGLAEAALAVVTLVVGGWASFALLGVSYAVFAGVSLRALRTDGASCGCFGAHSAPMTATHVVVNLVGTAAATVVAIDGPAALLERLDDGVGASVAYLMFVLTGVGVTIALLTTGAELTSVRRTVRARSAGTPRTVAR